MNLLHTALLGTLTLAVSFGGGVVGSVVGRRLDGQAAATVTPGSTAIPAPAGAPTTPDDRLQAALARMLPAVVSVIADLPSTRQADGTVTQGQNLGSGVVVSAAGHVITAYHVVEGARALSVVLATGERRPAVLVSDDAPYTDLAMLRVPPQGLRVAALGDATRLRLAEPVYAVAGALFGVDHTVSGGVVSALGRSFPRTGVILDDLVQTDAAVNHGDSGGALMNRDGELVGLLTTVVRANEVEGVAFAQSTNSLRPAIEAIAAGSAYPRPRLGIEYPGREHVELSPDYASANRLSVPYGALLVTPDPRGRGVAAGLRAGDIVIAVNGVAVDLDHPLPNLLKALRPGQTAVLGVLRDSRQLTITTAPWGQP